MDRTVMMVPLTADELTEVQVLIVDRMLNLNRELHDGKCPEDKAEEELATLTQVSKKVSRIANRG